MRWVDDIKKHAASTNIVTNREEWKRIGKANVQIQTEEGQLYRQIDIYKLIFCKIMFANDILKKSFKK